MSLSLASFQKEVTNEWEAMRKLATKLIIPSPNQRTVFSRALAAPSLGRCTTRDTSAKAAARIPKVGGITTLRKQSAYFRFLSARGVELKEDFPHESAMQRNGRVQAEWPGLPDDRKRHYQSCADAMNESGENDPSGELRRPSGGFKVQGARRMLLKQLRKIRNHTIYDAGLKLGSYEAGLKESLIDKTSPNKAIRTTVERSVCYDPKVLVNPTSRSMQRFRSCHELTAGHCIKDWGISVANSLTFNIYARTRDKRASFPLLLQFFYPESPEESSYVLLTKLVGAGKTALFIPLRRSGACEDEDVFKFVPAFEDRAVLPMTAQRLFLELLRAANRHLDVEPDRMVRLSMRQFAFVRDTEVDYFRVVRKDIVEDTDLPCPCRLTVGKKKVSSKDTSEIQLPFGIVVDMPAAKKKKKGGGTDECSSSTDSDGSNVSLAAKKLAAKEGPSSAGDTSNPDAGSESDGLPLPASTVIGIQLADHALQECVLDLQYLTSSWSRSYTVPHCESQFMGAPSVCPCALYQWATKRY